MPRLLWSREIRFLFIFVLLFTMGGCGGIKIVRIPIPIPTFGIGSHPKPAKPKVRSNQQEPSNDQILPSERVQYGRASWYGKEFHGKRAANGERYNMYALTAAHRTLPFDTKIKVTNLENGESCILRINDRGPFVDGRILDISYQGAKELGFLNKGVTEVRVEVL